MTHRVARSTSSGGAGTGGDAMVHGGMPPCAGIPDPAPILVGIVGTASADTALRAGLDRADACGAAVLVVCAGPATAADDAFLRDRIERWSEKYPRVRLTTRICRSIDAAVTLTAASRPCRIVVLADSTEPATAAVITAVARRAHCAVFVENEPPNGQ